MGTPLFPNWVLLAAPIILTVVVMSFLSRIYSYGHSRSTRAPRHSPQSELVNR